MSRLASAVRLSAGFVRRERATDVHGRIEGGGVGRSFFLCATPRSGSNLLARLLAGTQLVGLAGERFNHHELPGWAHARPGAYLVECAKDARGTSVLGLKLHWDQVEPFLGLLRRLRGVGGLSDRELVERVFPEPTFVWLRREDEVAQGVSWWKAKTSGAWLGGRAGRREPWFDFDEIDTRIRRVREHNDAWARWFSSNSLDPLSITYEEVAAEPVPAVGRVLLHLGLDAPADLAIEPRTQRQADDVNREWIDRYLELARVNSGHTT